jgi:ABC-type molybdate transport system substrate-binding protein
MVPPGNPAGIRSVSDLGQDNLRISQPGEMEDISFYIADMHRKAGGDALAKQILETKRIEGTTLFTTVHHRETLLRIQEGAVDVGPVWATEVYNAINSGMKVEKVEPGEGLDQREKVNYHIARIVRGAHPENAEKFLNFIQSSPAQDTYSRLGFVPHFE